FQGRPMRRLSRNKLFKKLKVFNEVSNSIVIQIRNPTTPSHRSFTQFRQSEPLSQGILHIFVFDVWKVKITVRKLNGGGVLQSIVHQVSSFTNLPLSIL